MDFFSKYISPFSKVVLFFDVCPKRILPELLQQPQLPLMNAKMKRTNPCTASMMRPPRQQRPHGPGKTWPKGPLDYRLMEDTIELVFLGVRGDWKTKPIINNSLKV